MLSALAEPPWCVCSAGPGTPAVFPLGVTWLAALLGFPCWLFIYAWQAVREALLFLLSIWWSSALQGCLGGRGEGSFFRPFGFPEVGTFSFPAVVCPSIGRPGGTGLRSLGLRMGYCLPFLSTPPLSNVPIPMPSSSPTSIKGAVLEEVTLGFIAKGAVELHPPPSPDLYSRLFVVWKSSGSWRPVLDLSHLIRFVDVSPFQMGTIQSVLLSVRQGVWMASITLMEAYLQVPVPPASRHFLRFMFRDTVLSFQSTVLWPLPCSAGLHQGHGSCFCYTPFSGGPYETVSRRLARPVTLSRVPPRGSSDCPPTLSRVGDCGQPPATNLVPSQVVLYLGVVIDSASFWASPSAERISRLQSTAAEFQSCASPTARLWLSLLGVLSSLAHLVPGGRLRMRSLQLCLHRSWDRQDLEALVYTSMECLRDIQW